jgi:hypothetical protein
MDILDIDTAEHTAEEAITAHTFRIRGTFRSGNAFRSVLLQRRWISYHFTPIYDLGLDLISNENESAKQTIRRIIREEYPNDRGSWKTPSHREDLMTDLRSMGVSDKEIKASTPSQETLSTILSVYSAISRYGADKHSDLRLIAFLRVWGEVLTAIEYEGLWPRIQTLLNGRESIFYEYHMAHDKRACTLATVVKDKHRTSHADLLGRALMKALPENPKEQGGALAAIFDVTTEARNSKEAFYRQFKSP